MSSLDSLPSYTLRAFKVNTSLFWVKQQLIVLTFLYLNVFIMFLAHFTKQDCFRRITCRLTYILVNNVPLVVLVGITKTLYNKKIKIFYLVEFYIRYILISIFCLKIRNVNYTGTYLLPKTTTKSTWKLPYDSNILLYFTVCLPIFVYM